MKFSEERKQMIRHYLLEKIAKKTPSVAKTVAETLELDPSTVHAYLKELCDREIIRKVKRGEYELVSREYKYTLSRSKGELNSDTYAFNVCIRPHIQDLPPNIYDAWAYVFSEMTNNVMDHSMAEQIKVTVNRDYMSTSAILSDDGIGIFKKIREHFGLASADEAICELFKGKLTTDQANHSGEGIFFSSRIMDEFCIVSDGKLFTINKYDDSRIFSFSQEAQKGTLVYMELSNFSRKTTSEVFDAYADTDGDFVRTRIPLRNIFDTSPVSRSQAKRLCARLDSFREVILDFDGLTWMGQGFAHQLFVVFAGAHPDIILTPKNMNEDIAKMIGHVTARDR